MIPVLNLDHDVEGRGRLSLQDGFLSAASFCLLIAQSNRLNPTDKVTQGRIHDQVVQRVSMSGGHKLHPTLGDGTCCLSLELGTDLIDHNDLGHVVFHRLNHYGMLKLRGDHLHPAGMPDGRMGDIAVTGDLIGGVDNHNALLQVVGKDTSHLSKHSGLADAGSA